METLNHFNLALKLLKEEFYKNGSFGDSNSKLEEFIKLLTVYSYYELQDNQTNKVNNLLEKYSFDRNSDLLGGISKLLEQIKTEPRLLFADGVSIFGTQNTLNKEELTNEIAFDILELIRVNFELRHSNNDKFDLISELFGYFIRDNFRNNVEDAQYMTPQEVVDFISKISHIRIMDKKISGKDFWVCDPCSGVGSFLKSFVDQFNDKRKMSIVTVGQDKVSRMARLSQLNIGFSKANHSQYKDNSLLKGSHLDKYTGKIDLILTNPPFGAKFLSDDLKTSKDLYPIVEKFFDKSRPINSEILFIDRCISLLKPEGELFIIVPDSVISSRGLPEQYRQFLLDSANIQICSLIELPAVTFAQAGTRTKTVILHLKKSTKKNERIFIAKCNNIGFTVSLRKGVTRKRSEGENDLLKIAQAYEHFIKEPAIKILSKSPSCISENMSALNNIGWTPSFYNAEKLMIVNNLNHLKGRRLSELGEIANIITKDRKKEFRSKSAKCISILHVVNEDLIDLEALYSYYPKYSGIPCRPGDLLISKINPRIPRIVIVPEIEDELTCSNEFEILQAKNGINNFQLKILLSLPQVQIQIRNLTSGTSSSHNRIKTEQLRSIKIPLPDGSAETDIHYGNKLLEFEDIYRESIHLNSKKFLVKRDILSII